MKESQEGRRLLLGCRTDDEDLIPGHGVGEAQSGRLDLHELVMNWKVGKTGE